MPVTVVEMPTFEAAARKVKLTEAEFLEIADYLSRHPEAGDVIKGTGGIRKMRFARPGGGKRGGYRIIHFFMTRSRPLYLLSIYAKAHKGDLSPKELKQLAKIAAAVKQEAP